MDEKLDKTMTRVWAIWNYVEAALLITAGVLACVFRENQTLYSVFAYVIGSFVILDGVLRFILIINRFRKSQESAMLVAGFEITLGIVVILTEARNKGFFIEIMINFLSVLLVSIGVLFLVYSIVMIAKKITEQLFMPIMEIVFAAILIGVGVTMLVLYNVNDAGFKQIIMVILGIILILVALAMAVVTTIGLRKRAKKRNGKDRQEVVKKEEEFQATAAPTTVEVENEEKKDDGSKAQEATSKEIPSIESKDEQNYIEFQDSQKEE